MFIRKVKFEDYLNIKKLTKKYNLSIFKKKDWINIWKNNPYLKKEKKSFTRGWVLENKKKIVGHIGNIPTQYSYNLKNYNGSIISCWVVEPKHRLHSVRLVQEFVSQENNDFFIATTSNKKTAKTLSAFGWNRMPNNDYNNKLYIVLRSENVVRSYVKKNFFFSNIIINKLLYYIVSVVFKKKINYWKNFKISKEVKIYKNFNSDFDNLWKKLKNKKKKTFLFNRSSEWLNWHLGSKLKNKGAFILVNKKDKAIEGYAVCIIKKVKNLGLKKAVLTDLVSLEDNTRSYMDLILQSIEHSIKLKCDLLEIVGFKENKRKIIKNIKPFEKKSKFSPFFFKSNNLNLNKALLKKEIWDPSEIDGDSIY